MSYRLGVSITHPIQYYSPWFRHLESRLDLEIFYAHRQSAHGQKSAGFGVEFEWDTPGLLEGYRFSWLRNVADNPSVANFSGCDTPEIHDVIGTKKFDAFLVVGWNHKSSLQAICACLKYGVPVLMRSDSQLCTPRARWVSAVKYLPYRWFLQRLNAHLHVGFRNRDYLKHYGVLDDALFFVPHFVDNRFFADRAAMAARNGAVDDLRRRFGISKEGFVFAFVGKMTEKKRPTDLIRAGIELVRDPTFEDVHVVFVGDGPLCRSLQEKAREFRGRIHFSGFCNQTDLPAYYQMADALVLPSDGAETWGLVINESMACGKPAIVSDAVGCAPDLIDEGQTGFTFPLGGVDLLLARMKDLFQLCQKNNDSTRAAVLRKADDYSMERATHGLERALGAVLNTREESAA